MLNRRFGFETTSQKSEVLPLADASHFEARHVTTRETNSATFRLFTKVEPESDWPIHKTQRLPLRWYHLGHSLSLHLGLKIKL